MFWQTAPWKPICKPFQRRAFTATAATKHPNLSPNSLSHVFAEIQPLVFKTPLPPKAPTKK